MPYSVHSYVQFGNYEQTVTAGTCNWFYAHDYTQTTSTVTVNTYYGMMSTLGTINSYTVVNTGQETEEQRLEREQRYRDWEAKEAVRRKRAREILLAALTVEQREQFLQEEHFELQVNGRLYRVRPGRRVERLDPETKTVQSLFCIHPELAHDLPSEDVALSQKLLLEANEPEFLRLANETKAA